MAENGRVHPDCVNAANPYHECGVACLEKISQGQGRKEKKKSDYHNGVNGSWLSKNMDGERRAQPTCPKASNPYHKCEEFCSNRTAEPKPGGVKKETGGAKPCPKASNPYHKCEEFCSNRTADANPRGVKKQSERAQPCPRASNPSHKCDEFCSNRTLEANPQGVEKESGSFLDTALSFGRKKKESESQQNSPRAVNNAPAVKGAVNNAPAVKAVRRAPPSPLILPTKKDEEPKNSRSFSSSQPHSDESYSEDHALDKVPVQSPGPMHVSGKITPDPPKSPSKISLACYKIPTPAEPQQNGKLHGSPKAAPYPSANHEGRVTNGPITEYLNFSFSGISRASEGSDGEEVQSVVSDSCVSVGKYHVRANVASILQLIFEKYGDIATGSRLESASMRAYYLECLCFVVQELQCTPFKQLTKSKVREMLAVLKDVESAQIDVSWLRDILNDLAEGMELSNQHQAAEESKSNCDDLIESKKKELESMMEDLALKEKAVADAKAQITETRTHLSNLELESSKLGETISSIQSRVKKFHEKPLADEIL
ncbi:uncharacterized protein LOC133680296 isoform X1 [Populus nigra]|uniref:uncharacterized protein LOC133680296 isoform X1 n=1 Tax=Populus nigra TaxID=3691 RepID=UPI002B264AD6|nr:uncharacterized protein LOC133680296 isoform X1 [Populus nigra]XP_061959135.1 uncharacterized protein LOC133680296 isoform X1 [Populus nigra]XP_061959136.1 uncharacterized protein LOC133680296 isoform X1 [Populus nigra]